MSFIHFGCSILWWIKQSEALGDREVLALVDQILLCLFQVIFLFVKLFHGIYQVIFVEAFHVGYSSPSHLIKVVYLPLTFEEVVLLLVPNFIVSVLL